MRIVACACVLCYNGFTHCVSAGLVERHFFSLTTEMHGLIRCNIISSDFTCIIFCLFLWLESAKFSDFPMEKE
jgi:hypothetical protein